VNKRVETLKHEAGFTIIEVMVAALLLVIGVLGTVRLIDGANAAQVLTRDRVAGLNLARDVVEAARNIDYDQLTCATGTSACGNSDVAVTALKGQSGLDSNSATSWTVTRSGITYTVGPVKVCKVDESRDGLGANDPSDPTFCATYTCPSASVTNCGDKNPDDYRKIDVTVTWTPGSGIVGRKSVRQVALIANPSGGLGPSIKLGPCALSSEATSSTAACPSPPITYIREAGRPACDGTHGTPIAASCVTTPSCGASPCIPFWLQTGSADTGSTHWSADDGKSNGDGVSLGSATKWKLNWPLGSLNTSVVNPFTVPPSLCTQAQPAPIFTLAAAQNVVLDGNYQVTFQAFDTLAVPGALKLVTVTLNRYPPSIPCPLNGGYNAPDSSTGNSPVVEFDWTPNVERDIKGYNVYWTGVDQVVNGNDVKVCGSAPVVATSCQDTNPSAHGLSSAGDTAIFYLTAVDNADSESQASLPLVVTLAANQKPNTPRATDGSGGAPTLAIVNGQPTISWSTDAAQYPSGRLDPDVLDTVIKYRIYRDGKAYSNRIATVPFPTGSTTDSFSDTNAPTGSHTYYVTAVDNHYQESVPAGPIS
jgi:hypothetical protein